MARRALAQVRGVAGIAGGLAVLLLTLLAPTPARAGGSVCKGCVEASNDTASSPGIVGISRYALAPAFNPPILFVGVDQRLRCAVPVGNAWQIEVVDPVSHAGGCALDVDSLGAEIVSYHDENGLLWFGHRAAAGWAIEPVPPAGPVSGATTITRVPGGVGIAYQGLANAQLAYAERLGSGPWLAESVASGVLGPAAPSLVADGTLRAIAYYDGERGDLRFAMRQAGSAWSIVTIDSVGDVGGDPSLIGRASQGGFGIAYYDYTNADLKYAHQAPSGWVSETVDGTGSRVGRGCSAVALTASPADLIGIAYHDQTHASLEYAVKHGPGWVKSEQDTAGDSGAWLACGINASPLDTVGIAYVDRASGDLNYLWHAGATASVPEHAPARAALHVAWSRAAGAEGGQLSFTVPVAGPVRVSVYDAQGRTLAVPLSRVLPAGPAAVRWDGRDRGGRRLASGMCFARVEAAGAAASVPAPLIH